jgi:hypothetical protein
MRLTVLIPLLSWCVVSPGADPSPSFHVESRLFITAPSDGSYSTYDSMAEETDLRGLLKRLEAATQITVVEQGDAVTTTMRLLRRADDGPLVLFAVHYQDLLTLTMTWKKTAAGTIDRDTALGQLYGFISAVKAMAAAKAGN